MRLLLVLLMNVFFLLVAAQREEDVFTVRNPYNVWLQPPMEQLVAGRAYHFKVKGIALADISSATMNRAKVLLTDTDIVITPQPVATEPRTDSLELFIIKNGKQRRVLNQVFKIVKLPSLALTDTTARNRNLPNEMFLHWYTGRHQLFKSDKATVLEIKGSPNTLTASMSARQAAIISYKMDINCGTGVRTFTSISGAITPAMRTVLSDITAGCTIKLYDVKCVRSGSSNDENIIGPYSILVTE